MMILLGASNLAALAADIPRVIDGDAEAWSELVILLEPQLFLLLRRSETFKPLRHDMNETWAVIFAVMVRLRADNFRGLRMWESWANSHPEKHFGDWIQIVTDNIAREHVSSRLCTVAT